jgi:hypothetical protein
MKTTKNQPNYSSYLTGFGVGTLMSPILLRILGATVSSQQQLIVWGIGIVVVVVAWVIEKRTTVI